LKGAALSKVSVPRLDEIANDTPLRLEVAAALAFPGGGMTVSGLRKEAARGRLVIERIAGRDYTTLAAIAKMRGQCRVQPKGLVSISYQPAETKLAASPEPPDGSSATATACTPQDALQAKLQKLIKPSPTTSAKRTGRRAGNVVSLKSRSQMS
jgi:hypothetical protein